MSNGRLRPEVAMKEGRAWAREALAAAIGDPKRFPTARQRALFNDKAIEQIRLVALEVIESLVDVTDKQRRRTDWD